VKQHQHDRHGEDVFTLTRAQHQMLADSLENAERGSYIEQIVCNTNDVIDLDLFKRCLSQLTQECPALNLCVFKNDNNNWQQVYNETAIVPLQLVDWSTVKTSRIQKRTSDFLKEDRQVRFRFESNRSLARISFLRLPENKTIWILTFHHIILDGRSLLILYERLLDLYDNMTFDRVSKRTLNKHMGFQRICYDLASRHSRREVAKAFWKQHLRRIPFEQTWATLNPAATQEHVEYPLSEPLAASTRSFAKKNGLPLHLIIEATLGFTLAWCLGKPSLCIGSVRAGRRHLPGELRDCVGMLINTLPIPIIVEDDESALDWLKKMTRFRKELREHEQSTLAEIRSALNLKTDKLLFDTVFVSADREVASEFNHRFGQQGLREFKFHECTSLPLVVSIGIKPNIQLDFTYDRGSQYRQRMKTLPARFEQVLQSFVDSPEQALKETCLLLRSEQALIKTANAGATLDFPQNFRLYDWFDQSQKKSSSRIAIIADDTRLDYGQLHDLSLFILSRITRHNLGTGKLIGVLLPRSAQLLGSILAISRSGNTYLPLDTTTPDDRLATFLDKAQPALVITDAESDQRINNQYERLVLKQDSMIAGINEAVQPLETAAADALAYAIFTSGSTGTPKLVGIENKQINNLLHFSTTQVLRPEFVSYVPFIDGIGSDASIHQIFGTLALGGTLVTVNDFADIFNSSDYNKWTCLGTTPSLLQAILRQQELPPSIRFVGLGAEVIPSSLYEKFNQHPALEKVVNYYGPTEATIYCLMATVWERSRPPSAYLNGRIIGKPIANSSYSIRDKQGRHCPPGTKGELWIHGACVGRGYINEDDEACGFIVDQCGTRLYKTGDICQKNRDGNVEFNGRSDSQIKINGIRVELGDIEAQIEAINCVDQVVVMMTEDERLVAFYKLHEKAAFDEERVIAKLKSKLRISVIPHLWIEVTELPLTISGKIDRRKLLPLLAEKEQARGTSNQAESELELGLLKIWKELLNREDIALTDNFFGLGGDSLSVIHLAEEVRQKLRLPLAAALIYQHPTIRQIARHINSQDVQKTFHYLYEMRKGTGATTLFCVHGYYGEIIEFRDLLPHLDNAHNLVGLNFSGNPNDLSADINTLDKLVAKYADEMIQYQPTGKFHLLGYSIGGIYAFEVARKLKERGREVGLLCMLETDPSPALTETERSEWLRNFHLIQTLYHIKSLQFISPFKWPEYLAMRLKAMSILIRRKFQPKATEPTAEVLNHSGFLISLVTAHILTPSQIEIDYLSSPAFPKVYCNIWKRYARGGVRRHRVKGAHDELLRGANASPIAKLINELLIRR
jgi:amino acid adenylation domain-containing protein